MGNTKKKSETEKVEKKESGISAAEFAELRDDLFREAAKLVSEVPSTRIAIFVTPPSSESDVSIHSFAHPSVESVVVQTFLEDKCPVPVPEDAEEEDEQDDDEEEDPAPQRFWWEDKKQYNSMNPEQLDAAYDRLSRLRDRMSLHLEAKLRAQRSGNQEDLHNDKAEPKP